MNCKIIDRIERIEKKFPRLDYIIEEHINEIIIMIEEILKYNIRDRIQIPNYKFIEEEKLDRKIFSFLNVDELRKIAYYNEE